MSEETVEFKVGDVVIVKSGSPKMTVAEVSDGYSSITGIGVKCQWFNNDRELNEEVFPLLFL